jgi:hypothetical protein
MRSLACLAAIALVVEQAGVSDAQPLQLAAPQQLRQTDPPAVVRWNQRKTTAANSQRKVEVFFASFVAVGVISAILGAAFVGLAQRENNAVFAGNVYHPAAEDRRNAFKSAYSGFFTISAAAIPIMYVVGNGCFRER